MNEKKVAELMAKHGIELLQLNFDCGGDSMGEIYVEDFDKLPEKYHKEVEDYLVGESYNRVNFWVNSDGYYIGERGTVDITIDEGNSNTLNFYKNAQAEWCESKTKSCSVLFSETEVELLKQRVSRIEGNSFEFVFTYKNDFIITDEVQTLLDSIKAKILDEYNSQCDDIADENLADGEVTFSTEEDLWEDSDKGLEFYADEMTLNLFYSVYEYTPSEN